MAPFKILLITNCICLSLACGIAAVHMNIDKKTSFDRFCRRYWLFLPLWVTLINQLLYFANQPLSLQECRPATQRFIEPTNQLAMPSGLREQLDVAKA